MNKSSHGHRHETSVIPPWSNHVRIDLKTLINFFAINALINVYEFSRHAQPCGLFAPDGVVYSRPVVVRTPAVFYNSADGERKENKSTLPNTDSPPFAE